MRASALADLNAAPAPEAPETPGDAEAAPKGPPAPFAPAAPAAPAPEEGWTRVGVIVASRRGLPGDKPLRFAYQDGEKLERLLATVGQVEPGNLFLLKSERREPLRLEAAKVGARIAALKQAGKRVFLQFYYTGHGAARNFHFSDGPLGFDEVKEALGGSRADARVYVLDVCYGASFFTAKGFRTAPPVQLQLEMDKTARGEVTISSSAGDEQAYEVRTLGGSIFTSHWIMALRGAGDRNRDGQVTLFEAYNYAYDRTSGYSAETLARPQHPSFQIDLTGARDVMLARQLRASTGLLFRNCPAGNYQVLDLGRGHTIGELRVPDGEEFSLALEQGRYRVQYHPAKGKALSADVDLPASGMAPLPFNAFGPAPEGAALGKGFAPLPPDPFDSEPRFASFQGENRLRWSFSVGGGLLRDDELAGNFQEPSDIDRHFSLGGRFRAPSSKTAFETDAAWSPVGLWLVGARIGLASATWSRHAEGLEPLESLGEAERRDYPVKLDWNYRFLDWSLILHAGRGFPLSASQGLSVDLGGGWVFRDGAGSRKVTRTLYETTVKSSQDMRAAGFRAEASLGYSLYQGVKHAATVMEVGLRLTPYYQALKEEWPEPGVPALHSRELGTILSVTLSVGRRRAHPGGEP